MKKVVKLAILIMLLVLPMKIKAITTKGTTIMGQTEVVAGNEFSLSFIVSYDGIHGGYDSTLGIWFVDFVLEMDEEVLGISGISSSEFDAIVFKEEESGKIYVMGETKGNSPFGNNCANGVLHCADFLVTLNFFAKKDENITTEIKMKEVETALLDMKDPMKEYTLDDAIELDFDSKTTHTIQIKKNENKTIEIPEEIVQEKEEINVKPSVENKKSPSTNDLKLDTNASLKNLEIEGYNIDFNKSKTEYTLNIESEINELAIKAVPESEKATYKIIGAEDIKANNYKITIEVTAENKDVVKYTINVILKESTTPEKEEKEQKVKKNLIQTMKEKIKNIKKETLIYGGIMIGCIVLLIIVVIINKMVKNHKMNKLLDKI